MKRLNNNELRKRLIGVGGMDEGSTHSLFLKSIKYFDSIKYYTFERLCDFSLHLFIHLFISCSKWGICEVYAIELRRTFANAKIENDCVSDLCL